MIRISYKESTAGARQLPAYHTGHHTLEFSGDVLTIGRSRVCDLVLADKLVSGEHCELRVRSGALFLYDLHSMNGTFVNEQGVVIRRIASTDIIQVGDTTFIASYEEITETSGLHPPGTARSRLEPASLERRPAVEFAAPREKAAAVQSPPPSERRPLKTALLWTSGLLQRRPRLDPKAKRVAPREEFAPFSSPPSPKAWSLKPSLLWAAGLMGLGCAFFENKIGALLPVVFLFGLDALWRHLDNQSLILKELRRLQRTRLPTGRETANL